MFHLFGHSAKGKAGLTPEALRTRLVRPEESQVVQVVKDAIERDILFDGLRLYDVFLDMDTDCSGKLSGPEVRRGLARVVGIRLTLDEVEEFMAAVAEFSPDHPHGLVSFQDLFRAFGKSGTE